MPEPGDAGYCPDSDSGGHCGCWTEDDQPCCACGSNCKVHCVCWSVSDGPCCFCGDVNPAWESVEEEA